MYSSDIELTSFRQILILPITLSSEAIAGTPGDREGRVARKIHEIAKGLAKTDGWDEATDHLAYLAENDELNDEDNAAYSEFVYFHAYIQAFLYDKGGKTEERPLRLFRRKAPGELEMGLDIDAWTLGEESGKTRIDVTLPIERMHLYLFELGVAILAIEVAIPAKPTVRIGSEVRPMKLAHAQALNNALRRLYPPYFLEDTIKENRVDAIPEYPASLKWSISPGTVRLLPRTWIAQVVANRRNPVDPVWKRILSPIVIDPETLGDKPNWRQIIDERIPSMMMLGVREASGMTRGDFVRLCFQDEPGRDEYPYAESFLEGFEKKHCYDRFWHGETGTRYMFSGYSMIMFGNGDPANPKDFFHATLGEHFRRHYFQMGLLIQLQFAALLSLSHRVSEAVKNKKNGDKTVFRDEMLDIEREFLAFEQRYWFSQVSNQLQAREIYDLWLERTNVAKVYLEVREQVRAANTYLDAREQAAQTSATTRLSVIATFGVISGAALAFLGMNVLMSADFLAGFFGVPKDLSGQASTGGAGHFDRINFAAAHLATFFGALTLFFGLGRWLLRRYPGREKSAVTERLNGDLGLVAILSLSLCIALSLTLILRR